MSGIRECTAELFALLQPLLEPEGYTCPSKARWFARQLGPGVEGRVEVSVITYRGGGFTASFPTGIRFEAVEQVRNRFRSAMASLQKLPAAPPTTQQSP